MNAMQIETSEPNLKRKQQSRFRTLLIVGLGAILVSVFFVLVSNNEKDHDAVLESKNDKDGDAAVVEDLANGNVEYSLNGQSRSVAYYHCASQMPQADSQHLVLLHGSSFTKENWKRSGILDTLCEDPFLSVSAVDLPVSAGHEDLMGMLSAMKDSHLIDLPVAMVSPSASGRTITDWVARGNVEDLPNYVHRWIPVACGSVKSLTSDQLAEMAQLQPDFSVFAIYGDRDSGGRSVTNLLMTSVGAKGLELEGGHSVYLNSPDEFCDAVLDDLHLDCED